MNVYGRINSVTGKAYSIGRENKIVNVPLWTCKLPAPQSSGSCFRLHISEQTEREHVHNGRAALYIPTRKFRWWEGKRGNPVAQDTATPFAMYLAAPDIKRLT